jgi:hypothetical protein
MSSNANPALQSLRHLTHKFDDIGEHMDDFMRRQADGQMPDPNEFTRLLELKSATKAAMTAQFNLLQKPLKTVLNEAK